VVYRLLVVNLETRGVEGAFDVGHGSGALARDPLSGSVYIRNRVRNRERLRVTHKDTQQGTLTNFRPKWMDMSWLSIRLHSRDIFQSRACTGVLCFVS